MVFGRFALLTLTTYSLDVSPQYLPPVKDCERGRKRTDSEDESENAFSVVFLSVLFCRPPSTIFTGSLGKKSREQNVQARDETT